jgi:hypothetical protein
MEKKEEILINEHEEVETKTSNKVKLAVAIIASTLVLAAATTLLIGHFKFDWFKSDNYKIDANINRSVYQANYFSEKKTVSTRISFENGPTENKQYVLDSNFVVFLTEKKENLNTAILVLLDSNMSSEEGQTELAHLNIFDEKEIKELEANPDGSKYPMAVFKFDDDGKIEEIKLPNNMDEYNAESIVELIEKVIPKLSRNRQEDMSNGLDIKTRKSKNKRTIVQRQTPRQYEAFKGSSSAKVVRTEIEDDQITRIESNSNIQLHSQPEEEQIIFGPKDFSFDLRSNIESKEVKYDEKENVELAIKLAEKFTLIDSKDLLESIKAKKEEQKKQEEVIAEETRPLRQLSFPISASKEFKIASFNLLGQTITIKYVVSISKSSATNKIVISSNLGSFTFGNGGCSGEAGNTYSYYKHIFTFVFPNFPAVSVGCYASGSLSWKIGFQSGSGTGAKYYASLSGVLKLGAEIKAGWDAIASLSAYAEGTVADASGKVTFSNGSVAKGSGFSLKMGGLVAGIRGCLFSKKIELVKHTIFSGWSYA